MRTKGPEGWVQKNGFNRRMLQTRKRLGLTILEVADTIGVHPNTIVKLENGASEPGLFTLYKLAVLYNVSIDWLIGRPVKQFLPVWQEEVGLKHAGSGG